MSSIVNKYTSNERKKSAFYVFSSVIIFLCVYAHILHVILLLFHCVFVSSLRVLLLLIRSWYRETMKKTAAISVTRKLIQFPSIMNVRSEWYHDGVRQTNNRNTIHMIVNIFPMCETQRCLHHQAQNDMDHIHLMRMRNCVVGFFFPNNLLRKLYVY